MEDIDFGAGLCLTINRNKLAVIKIGEDVTVIARRHGTSYRLIIQAPQEQRISRQMIDLKPRVEEEVEDELS